jgi:hypothetical protein
MGNMGNRITQTENKNNRNIGEFLVNSKSESKNKGVVDYCLPFTRVVNVEMPLERVDHGTDRERR